MGWDPIYDQYYIGEHILDERQWIYREMVSTNDKLKKTREIKREMLNLLPDRIVTEIDKYREVDKERSAHQCYGIYKIIAERIKLNKSILSSVYITGTPQPDVEPKIIDLIIRSISPEETREKIKYHMIQKLIKKKYLPKRNKLQRYHGGNIKW